MEHLAVAVSLQVKLEKSSLTSACKVQLSKDANAVKVQLANQDIKEKCPWTNDELCKRLTARYSDFKMNNDFHAVRKPLLENEKYAEGRYLDPENKAGPQKQYFKANTLQAFDDRYMKK